MSDVSVCPMTEGEFDDWQSALAEEFAAEQVAIGRWAQEGALQRALDSNAELLPLGISTPRMLLLRGVDSDGELVGRAWVALDHPRGAPDMAYLYDFEVVAQRRGTGLGRALLAAVEVAVADAGIFALELNVFGHNLPAVSLYGSSGYAVTTQQMRKDLRPITPHSLPASPADRRMTHHVAVGALIGPRGILLAHRRSDLRYYPNCWDFPGGHLEPGETPAAGLVRELREELGIAAVVEGEPRLRILDDAESAEGLVLDLWVIAEWAGEVANQAPEEHDELRWFDLADVASMQLAHPDYQAFIAGLLRP